MISDSRARIIFVNKATVRGLGYPLKDILYRPVTDFFQEKIGFSKWKKTYFDEIRKKKKPAVYIINRLVKGGKVRTIEITAAHMVYRSEDYILTVGRDITQQLAFQTRLKASEDRYRVLSEQAAEGILMVNMNGMIMYANKAAAQMFKMPVSKVIGTHFSAYMERSSLPKAQACFSLVKGGAPSVCNDLDIRSKDGKIIPSEFIASPIFIGKKVTQAHVLFRNMSQRKEMEKLVRESEKMKALQHFVAGMAREIQHPLKGLAVRSQGLINKYQNCYFEYIGYKEFSDIMKTLRTINDQVKYCYETTEKIVSLSRRKAKVEGRHCDVDAVIRETVNLLKHSLESSDIDVALKISSHLPRVAIGAFDLGQALNNVLSNAIQSLPSGGGKIRIKATCQKARSVRIDCQDDGIGIPPEVLGRVFEPFFTTKSHGLAKSSGLGLSVVYSIITSHQGEVMIKSDVHKGTLVTILLPVYGSFKQSKRK